MADGSGAGEQQVRGENTQENKVVSQRARDRSEIIYIRCPGGV